MSRELVIRNRQRRFRVAGRRLRRIVEGLLEGDVGLEDWELGIHLVGAEAMARVNWQWLQHSGSTDVITFNHLESEAVGVPHGEKSGGCSGPGSAGDPAAAVVEGGPVPGSPLKDRARGSVRPFNPQHTTHNPLPRPMGPRRVHGELFISLDDAATQGREFGTSAGAELVRYIVHGLLHLLGYDDLEAGARRCMKREEERLVRRLASQHSVRGLVVRRTVPSSPGGVRRRLKPGQG